MPPADAEELARLRADPRTARTAHQDLRRTAAQRALLGARLSRYPVDDDQMAPTLLGNAIRRLEEYGYDRFRLDGQVLWNELTGTAPEQIHRQAELSRTNAYFFVALLYGHAALAVLSLGALACADGEPVTLLGTAAALGLPPPVEGHRGSVDTVAVFSDADAAALYDLLNPWDPERWSGDAFYAESVMAAGSVLDVGCGTGSMLHWSREHGHVGRLVGLDPDPAALTRARRRADIEWIDGMAADAKWQAEFDLATMTGHAFQFLVTDDDVRASLGAIRAALREGGRFAFETRHPQARAWEAWNPSNAADITDAAGRILRVWHEVEAVADGVVTFTGTTADPCGTVLRVDRAVLRFLDVLTLDTFLAEAGFEIEARYGDWQRGPVTPASQEIITIARRP